MRSVDPMARRAKSHRGDLGRRCCLGSVGATTGDKESMVQRKPVAFRLWAPVAIGAPLLVDRLATLVRRAPGLGGGRSARLGLLLMLVGVERMVAVAVPPARDWATAAQAMPAMNEGPYRLSATPLFVG
jgi:hypothetical protein